MTIVGLSDLDTFIRDSLYEVRRGIANSRNATQANPLLGVMVDLPEKLDFEIAVTSGYQSLTRETTSSENRLDSELSGIKSLNTTLSKDTELSSSAERTYESAISKNIESMLGASISKEQDLKNGNSLDVENRKLGDIDSELKIVSGFDAEQKTGLGSENEGKAGNGVESESRVGLGAENETRRGSGTENDTKQGAGSETESKAGTGTENDLKTGSGTENESRAGSGTENETKTGNATETEKRNGTETETDNKASSGNETQNKTSKQVEVHLEANDRASKSFDEEDGTWGMQGQISTPQYVGGSPCNCG